MSRSVRDVFKILFLILAVALSACWVALKIAQAAGYTLVFEIGDYCWFALIVTCLTLCVFLLPLRDALKNRAARVAVTLLLLAVTAFGWYAAFVSFSYTCQNAGQTVQYRFSSPSGKNTLLVTSAPSSGGQIETFLLCGPFKNGLHNNMPPLKAGETLRGCHVIWVNDNTATLEVQVGKIRREVTLELD